MTAREYLSSCEMKKNCFNWMIPDLYLGNGCFIKHPFKTGCLGYQVAPVRKRPRPGQVGCGIFTQPEFFGGAVFVGFLWGETLPVKNAEDNDGEFNGFQWIFISNDQ